MIQLSTTAASSIAVPSVELDCGPFVVELGGLTGVKSLWHRESNQQTLIAFGVETSNQKGFLTLEHAGLGCRLLGGEVGLSERGYRRRWRYALGSDEFHAAETLNVSEDRIRRTLKISPTGAAALPIFDAVLRWGFAEKSVDKLIVGEKHIEYRRRNLYHQHPAESVRFELCGHDVELRTQTLLPLPAGMQQVLYARDAAEGWIVHHRVITQQPDHYYLRGCSRLWLGVMGISPRTLRWLPIRNWLYLIRERRVPRFPVQLMGDTAVPPGAAVNLVHELIFSSAERARR